MMSDHSNNVPCDSGTTGISVSHHPMMVSAQQQQDEIPAIPQHEGPKLGRRGDPRMHRAVAARLENPKLTLTEALQLGGFDVSSNEDEYGVTVGQRKNQLSRRLRLVRQSQAKGGEKTTSSSDNGSPSTGTDTGTTEQEETNKNDSLDAAVHNRNGSSEEQNHQQQEEEQSHLDESTAQAITESAIVADLKAKANAASSPSRTGTRTIHGRKSRSTPQQKDEQASTVQTPAPSIANLPNNPGLSHFLSSIGGLHQQQSQPPEQQDHHSAALRAATATQSPSQTLLQLHEAIRSSTNGQSATAAATAAVTAFGGGGAAPNVGDSMVQSILNGTAAHAPAPAPPNLPNAIEHAAALQSMLNAHRQQQQQKKATMDIAALAGGMAGMNQHALQALLSGRLRPRNHPSSSNSGFFKTTAAGQQGDGNTSRANPFGAASGDRVGDSSNVGSTGFKSVQHEDIFNSFVRQQKWLKEYLVRTCYQKGAASVAGAAACETTAAATGSTSRSYTSSDPPPPPRAAAPSAQMGTTSTSINTASRTTLPTSVTLGASATSNHDKRTEVHDDKGLIEQSKRNEEHKQRKQSPKNIEGDAKISSKRKYDSSLETTNDVRIEMVLTSYQIENASLLQRLMSQAGFSRDELMQHSPLYIEIASRAVYQEYERVQKLKETFLGDKHSVTSFLELKKKSPIEDACDNDDDDSTSSEISEEYRSRRKKRSKKHKKSHLTSFAKKGHRYNSTASTRKTSFASEEEEEQQQGKAASASSTGATCCNHTSPSNNIGRHVHRLMGKCGHRAIIHRPPNGEPHIDFIVNDRVECYQNVSPEASAVGCDTLWPSRYGCDELNCSTIDEEINDHATENNSGRTNSRGERQSDGHNHHHHHSHRGRPKCGSREESDRVKNPSSLPVPQEFDISILKEWDVDPFEGVGDHSILGLIELGKQYGSRI